MDENFLLKKERSRSMEKENIEVGEIFTIVDENDEEQEVEVLSVINLEGTEYAAVGFVEDIQEGTEEDLDVFFLKVDEDGDFSAVESNEEFDKVSAAFDEIMKED
ncbi:hypothetical protein QY97_03790 [Bacillus thermotolerans]|nr:hypothetical protein QY97_03790 [Bacillus thermotolerans]